MEKTRRLMVKLRIPREHASYLREHGALEEFVSAKMLGQDAEAKWLLKDVAKDDLDAVERRVRHRRAELEERGIELNADLTLKSVNNATRNKRVTVSPPKKPTAEEPAFVLTSSLTNDLTHKFTGVIRDVAFTELPQALLEKPAPANESTSVGTVSAPHSVSLKKAFATHRQSVQARGGDKPPQLFNNSILQISSFDRGESGPSTARAMLN